MAKTFTPDFFLQYSSEEHSESDRRKVDVSYDQNPCLPDELALIHEGREFLNEMEVRPSNRTIENILWFSKAYHVTDLSNGQQAGMILN